MVMQIFLDNFCASLISVHTRFETYVTRVDVKQTGVQKGPGHEETERQNKTMLLFVTFVLVIFAYSESREVIVSVEYHQCTINVDKTHNRITHLRKCHTKQVL